MNQDTEIYLGLVLIACLLTWLIWMAYKIWRKNYNILLTFGTNLSHAVENWPRANATILESNIEYDAFRKKWIPYVSWEYRFEGQVFRGSMLAPIKFIKNSKKECQKIVDFLKVGSTHKIYVNPKMHGTSYMFPKLDNRKFFTSK